MIPLFCVIASVAKISVQSVDGRFTASGHKNGEVYIFNNDTGRLLHSLPGMTVLDLPGLVFTDWDQG